ncbi:MAG: energy-coupling factor transporter ATPase [Thermofilaceae archaeon]
MSRAVFVEDLWWKYVGRSDYALRGVDLEVERGEFFAIMGHTGAGKTTLILALTGIIPQRVPGEFRGRVEVLGMSTLSRDVSEITKRVAVVFEDPEIQFVMSTVEDELVLSLEPLGLSREEIRERLEWSLELVGLDKSFLGRSPLQLSGGEKQRVAIAAAVARRPELLILDEPTSDLDPVGKEEVLTAIRKLRDELDMTIILIEHESEFVAELADRVAVLSEGRVAAVGEPRCVFSRYDELKSHGVYPPDAAAISFKLGLDTICRYGDLVRALESVRDRLFVHADRIPKVERMGEGEVLVECRDVEYVYPGGFRALKGVSLTIRGGELVALVGPNGGGKTTLAKVVSGLLRPSRGEVLVLGRRVEEYDRLTLSSLVCYVYQNPDHQIFNKSVYEEISFGLRIRGLPEGVVRERVERALEVFGLKGLENEHPFFLSKGEKRRLALASAYVLDPKVLIVDEPTTGQDMRFNESLFSNLKALTREGRAVVTITHSIALASKYADRLVVVKDGRVIADGHPRSVLLSPAADEGRLTKPQAMRLAKQLGLTVAPVSAEEFLEIVTLVK